MWLFLLHLSGPLLQFLAAGLRGRKQNTRRLGCGVLRQSESDKPSSRNNLSGAHQQLGLSNLQQLTRQDLGLSHPGTGTESKAPVFQIQTASSENGVWGGGIGGSGTRGGKLELWTCLHFSVIPRSFPWVLCPWICSPAALQPRCPASWSQGQTHTGLLLSYWLPFLFKVSLAGRTPFARTPEGEFKAREKELEKVSDYIRGTLTFGGSFNSLRPGKSSRA